MTRLYTYAHFGDLGDTIAALPTIASLGGGDLCLYRADRHRVREPYTPEKVDRVKSFFEAQTCITRCYYADQPPKSEGSAITVVLDEWRRRIHQKRNLADQVADTFKVNHWDRNRPWLKVNPTPVAEVVIHRSPRYQTADFPWAEVVKLYGHKAVFVGSVEEHSAFVRDFGGVPRLATPHLLDLAGVIAGAKFYFGNQSAPFWIRCGLCLAFHLERYERSDNCHWERANAFYGMRDWVKVRAYLAML